ncbi:MAG TPA: PAS domain S-box protein [Pyrinomonadaceae bacterium]|nr:PAS domain S-box protein [Pyrinomonadaceae bacterium]
MVTTRLDITETKQTETALRELESVLRSFFDSAGIMRGIIELEQNDILHVSDNALGAAFFGETKESMRATELGLPAEIVNLWIDHCRKSQRTGEVVSFEYSHRSLNGERWLSGCVSCLATSLRERPRFAYVIADITERKMAQEAIHELLQREQAARFEAEVVRDANFALTRNLSLEKVLETLLEYLGKLVPFESANVMLLEGDIKFVVVACRGYGTAPDSPAGHEISFGLDTHPALKRLYTLQRSVVVDDTRDDPAWKKVPGTDHVRNWLAAPLVVSGKVIGLYSMDKSEAGFFTSEHVRLAETLAPQAASAIQNALSFQQSQRYAAELEQRIAERERAEQALRESESLRRTIVESEPECVKVVGPDYSLLDMNPAGLAMVGAGSREQVVGQSVLSLIAPEWRESFMAMHERVCQGESVVSEFEIIGCTGVRRRVETHATPLRDSVSGAIAQLAITRDITERRRAEESLKIFRDLIDRSTDAIEVLDPKSLRFLDCNLNAHQQLGYSREEFLSLSAYDIDPCLNRALAARMVAEMEKSGFAVIESVHRRKDGSTFPVEINVKNIRLEKDYRLAIVRDISERKQAQERLQEYEKVVEGLEEMIAVVNRDFRYLLANQAYLDYLGMKREQIVGHLASEILDKDAYEQVVKKYLEECFQGKVVTYEMTYVFLEKGERQLSVSYFPIEGPNGIDRAACVLSDITEQKRAQESLRQSESQLTEAQRLASVGSWNWDVRTGAITWSDELYRIFGLQPQKMEFGKEAFEIIHPDDRELVINTVKDSLKTREAYSFYYRVCRPDGVERIVHTLGRVICDERGDPIRVFGATQDITEHRQAELALRHAEEKYRDIFEHAGEGIFQSTPEGRYISANPALARIHGFDSAEELIRNCTDISREIYAEPERREEFKSLLEQQGMVRGFEHQVIRKDGSRIWLTVNARVVRDAQGKVLYYEGTAQDINERKLAEARSGAFATLALRLSGAMTQLDAAKIIADTANELFSWDSCNLDLYDEGAHVIHPLLNMDTINGERIDVTDTIAELKPTPRSRRIIELGPELTLRKEPVNFDDDSIPFGDTSRPSASLMGVPICQADTVIGLLSIHSYAPDAYDDADLRDLQALAAYCGEALNRVRTEESLGKSEERYRELFENAKDAYYVHDLNGRYISVNRAAEKLSGYPRAEILGQRFSDFIAPEHLEVVSHNLCRKLIDEGETKYEIEVVAKDGRRVPVEVSSHLIYENGVAVCVQGTARDITERKRAEEALRQSEREYRGLFENAHDAILIFDPESEIVLEVNQRACEVYGIGRSEFVGLSLASISTDVERGRLVINETLKLGMSHDFETVQRRGDGTEMFLHLNSSVVEYNGKIAIQSINRDITEQKRAEEALRQSEERFSKAFHSSPAALSIALLEDGRLLEVNAAFLRMTGFGREEVIGRSTLELGLWDSQHWLMMAKALRERGAVVDFEIKFRKKSGEVRDALLSVELIQLGLGEPSVLGIAQDVTERNRAEEALQSYPRHLIEAQEAERQSIARELHDQIGQVLTAIHLNLQAVWTTCESNESRALIDEGVAIVDEALGQVRNLSFELRPSLLDDLGLATALRWYTDRFTHRTGIKSTTTINLPEPAARLTRELETACFRIVQEALTNVVRHARAKNVSLRLQKRNGEIRLAVKDDGIGFDAHSQNLAPFTTHVGLRGMRERALALGGRLDVRSSSRGTRISASFPNENKNEGLATQTE